MCAAHHRAFTAAALGCVLGSLPYPTAAQAQGASSDDTILVVGVTHGARSDTRLARALEEHLRLTGEVVAPGARLSTAERLCSDGECLEKLAKREHAVLALTANVRDSGPQSYFLTLALVDARRRLPVQTESVCDSCSGDELTTKLNDLSDKTLHLYRERRQGAAANPTATPSVSTNPGTEPKVIIPFTAPATGPSTAPPATGGPFSHLSTQRKIIAGVLGAAALGVLIPSIFWSIKDGQAAPGPCSDDPMALQDCRYDNKTLYGIGYATTVALTGGLLVALVFPESGKSTAATTPPPAEKAPQP